MAITVQEELYVDCIGDGKGLITKHWEEVALYKDKIKLNPGFVGYRMLADAGKMKFFTVRDDGKLIGYAAYAIHKHLHYMPHLWALSDIFWLDPEYRRGGIGTALFRFAEQILSDHGVSVMHTTIKTAHPAAGVLLTSLGHSLVEQGYSKILI